MAAPPFDVARAHRWFAVELNNLAWALAEADRPSPADLERLVHAAHAACFHWLESGDLLSYLRAQCLLATAYAKADRPADARSEHALARAAAAGLDDPGDRDVFEKFYPALCTAPLN